MGRTGEMFAWQHYGVKPDVMTVAKALGNGVPIGAFLACGKAATAMVPGDHGTTYGGNPLVTAAAGAVLDIFERDRSQTMSKRWELTFMKNWRSLPKIRYHLRPQRSGTDPGAGVYRSCRPYCIKSSFRGEAGFDQCRQPYYPVCAAAYYSEVGCG